MSTTPDPSRPSLEYYRKQAKSLLAAARRGDAEAAERVRQSVPRLRGGNDPLPKDLALHDAQLAIAREHGFASWPRFHAHLTAEGAIPNRRFRPHVREFKWYEDRIAGVMNMRQAGLPESLEVIRRNHPRFANVDDEELRSDFH